MISLKMAMTLAIPLAIALLITFYLATLSYKTRHHRLKPPAERHLIACPAKPNCVSSKSTEESNAIEAFPLFENNKTQSREKLLTAIKKIGGEILIDDDQYIHAVFTSSLFRFKDDFEAEINDTQIDIRSASRAGTSDLGQNRKRVEKLRQLYK